MKQNDSFAGTRNYLNCSVPNDGKTVFQYPCTFIVLNESAFHPITMTMYTSYSMYFVNLPNQKLVNLFENIKLFI